MDFVFGTLGIAKLPLRDIWRRSAHWGHCWLRVELTRLSAQRGHCISLLARLVPTSLHCHQLQFHLRGHCNRVRQLSLLALLLKPLSLPRRPRAGIRYQPPAQRVTLSRKAVTVTSSFQTAAMAGRNDSSDSEVVVSSRSEQRRVPANRSLCQEALAVEETATRPMLPSHGGANGARKPNGDQVQKGEFITVAIVGVPEGRWAMEFNKPLNSDPQFAAMFEHIWARALDDISQHKLPLTLSRSTDSGAMVIGLARVRSWSTDKGKTNNDQTLAMMRMLRDKHSRSKGICFLHHYAVKCALLAKPVPIAEGLDYGADFPDAYRAAVAESTFVVCHCSDPAQRSEVPSFHELIKRWKLDCQDNEMIYMWPLWWPLAQLFAIGHWSVDVTAIVPRMTDQLWQPPVMPPRSMLQMLRKACSTPESDIGVHSALSASAASSVAYHNETVKWNSATSSVPRPYDSAHIIRALIAARHLKQQGTTPEASKDFLEFMFPNQPEQQESLDARGFQAPKQTLMHKARPRFDIAAMISYREMYRRRGPFYRYIASDASPQRSESMEIFVSVERVVPRIAIADKKGFTTIRPEDIEHRVLPLTTLGQGKTDLPSKVIAQAPWDLLLLVQFIECVRSQSQWVIVIAMVVEYVCNGCIMEDMYSLYVRCRIWCFGSMLGFLRSL